MPLSPDEQAQYDQFRQQFGPISDGQATAILSQYSQPAAQPQQGLLARTGQQFANLPSSVLQGLANSAIGISNMGTPAPQQQPPVDVPKPYDIAPPTTWGQQGVDIGAGLASGIGQALIPGGIAKGLLGAMGAGSAAASIGGDIAAGGFLGAQTSPQESALSAAQFGGLGAVNAAPIPPWMKILANAAIPLAGEVARGQSLTSPQSLINMGVQVAVPGLLGGYRSAHASPENPSTDTRFQTQGAPYDPRGGDDWQMVPSTGRQIVPSSTPPDFVMMPDGTQVLSPRVIQPRNQYGELIEPPVAQLGNGQQMLGQGNSIYAPQYAGIYPDTPTSPDTRFEMPGYQPPDQPTAPKQLLLPGPSNPMAQAPTTRAGFDPNNPAIQSLAGAGAGALIAPVVDQDPDKSLGSKMLEGAALGGGATLLARAVPGAIARLQGNPIFRPTETPMIKPLDSVAKSIDAEPTDTSSYKMQLNGMTAYLDETPDKIVLRDLVSPNVRGVNPSDLLDALKAKGKPIELKPPDMLNPKALPPSFYTDRGFEPSVDANGNSGNMRWEPDGYDPPETSNLPEPFRAQVYHGTNEEFPAGDIKTEGVARTSADNNDVVGAFVSPDRNTAESFGPNVHSYDMRLDNPLDLRVDPRRSFDRDSFVRLLNSRGLDVTPEDVETVAGNDPVWKSGLPAPYADAWAPIAERLTPLMKEKGFDGMLGMTEHPTTNLPTEEYAAFNPDSLKPSTGMRQASGERGSISNPAVQSLAGAAVGAALGPVVDQDKAKSTGAKMLEGALVGGGLTLLGRMAPRALMVMREEPTTLKPMAGATSPPKAETLGAKIEDAATAQQRAKQTPVGAVSDFLKTQFGMRVGPEIRTALERGQGEEQTLGKQAATAINAFVKSKATLTDPQKVEGNAFVDSKGTPADIAALDASTMPQEAKDLFKSLKQLNIEAQGVYKGASAEPRASLIERTTGDYNARTYGIFTDPKQWSKDFKGGKFDQALSDTVDWMMTRPEQAGLNRDLVENNVRDFLDDMSTKKDSFDKGGSGKIAQALFIHRKDLMPSEWGMLERLRNDPRIDSMDQDTIKGMVNSRNLSPADREMLGQVARSGALSQPESEALDAIRQKATLPQPLRQLLGEHTDPVDRIAYTTMKLVGGIHTAKAISELADTKLPDGTKVAYTPAEYNQAYTAAKNGSDVDLFRRLSGYVQLDRVPGFGKLAGNFVDRGVSDGLNAFQQNMESGGSSMMAKIQSFMKLNTTVLNPGTHVHWWMQIPLMMMMGRNYNPAKWFEAGKIVMGNAAEHDAIRDELTRNNIVGANYSAQELKTGTNAISKLGQPEGPYAAIKTGKDKAVKLLGDLYGKPDDIIRTATYLRAKSEAMPAAVADAATQGLSGKAAADWAENTAQQTAIAFTNRYTFNYGATPPITNWARNIPGLNPFLSYTSELARISKNLGEDFINGSPTDRMHAALNFGLMAGVPAALSMGSEMANLKPDDRRKWDAISALEPDYLKGSIKMVLGRRKDGTFNYIDASPMIPAGDYYTVARDLVRGDFKQAALDQPVVGLSHSPLATLAMSLSQGQDIDTGKKYMDASDYAGAAYKAFAPPLLGRSAQRVISGFTPNQQGGLGIINSRTGREDTPVTSLLGAAGIRLSSENPANITRSFVSDLTDRTNQAKAEFLQTAATNAGPVQQAQAREKLTQRLIELQPKRDLLRKANQP